MRRVCVAGAVVVALVVGTGVTGVAGAHSPAAVDPPASVTLLHQHPNKDCSGDHDTLTWSTPDNLDGESLTGYHVEQLETGGDVPKLYQFDVDADTTSLPVTPHVGWVYFRVYAVTDEGWSAPNEVAMFADGVPSAQSFDFTYDLDAVQAHAITTSASWFEETKLAGVGGDYRDAAVTVAISPGGHSVKYKAQPPGVGVPVTFRGLDAATRYEFSVVVENKCGQSPAAGSPGFTTGAAPAWNQKTPPVTVPLGAHYRYRFRATGTPSPMYALQDAPPWLTIDPQTGTITGKPTNDTTQFSYRVVAYSTYGIEAIPSYLGAGPFLVAVGPQPPPSWAVMPSLNPSTVSDGLNAVSCASSPRCVAVGRTLGDDGRDRTLVETFDGTEWTVTPSPNVGANFYNDNVLSDVSCATPTRCVAVGNRATLRYRDTLTEIFDGASWKVVPSPNPAPGDHVLSGVSCATETNCVAVGSAGHPWMPATLIEMYDGSSWSVVESPRPGRTSELSSVACTGPSDCVAVGSFDNGSQRKTLVTHWDGSTWSVAVSPNRASVKASRLTDVACANASTCIAVGSSSGSVSRTLVEAFDGSAWSIAPSPNASPDADNWLNSVACVPGAGCTAVGGYAVQSLVRTLVEEWDGAHWVVTSGGNNGSDTNLVAGVSCVTAAGCIAVGAYRNGDTDQTLVLAKLP